MKSLLFLVAAAAMLSGCAYYPDPYYGAYGGYPGYGYAAPSVSIGVYGDGGYHHHGGDWRDGGGRWHDRR